MSQQKDYIPGMCNIGSAEVRSKRMLGWVGLILAAMFFIATFYTYVPFPFRVAIFLPLYLSALGFLQGYFQFCVNLGMQGLRNMSTAAGSKPERIQESAFCVQDRSRAQLILLSAFIVCLILTLVLAVI